MLSTPPSPAISTLTSFADLESVCREWDRLVAQAPDASTFVTPAWQLSWWQGYAPHAQLQVVLASRNDQPAGIAPMMLVREKQFGLPIRTLRFVGDGTFESDHMDIVTSETGSEGIRAAVLREFLRLPWDVAVLSNVRGSSPLAAEIEPWCRANELLLDSTAVPCPLRQLPESFDALLATLPSRFRTAIRSTRRKLAAAHTVEFGLHQDPAQFHDALQALFDNHESRWRAKGQCGVFANPRRREFYRRLTHRLHECGDLRFFYLKLDDRIVAQEYCFARGRTVYLLQEGFDFACAPLNVGNALRSHVFEYLIENGYAAYDFLAGTSRHKETWSDSSTQDMTFRIARPNLRGRWAHHAPRVVESAKSRLRPIHSRLTRRFQAPTAGADRT